MEVVEHFEERSSKGTVKDYYTQVAQISHAYNQPPYYYKILMDMVEVDPILFNAVSLTVDLATQNGYDFIGKNEKEIERARELFNDTLNFDEVIKNILWQLIVYGDAYLELRWNESKTEIEEIHPLETTEMKIKYDEHGEIEKYTQLPEGKSEKDAIPFDPDEVIHFRFYWVGSSVYSKCPLKAISRSFATKIHANNFLNSIFINLPPKIIHWLKNSNDKQRKLFVENLIRAKTNPNMDIIAQGEAFESKVLEPKFDPGLIQVLNYLRQEALMIFRIPPHWSGMMDGANRGIGENVVIPFESKIKDIHHRVASQVNRELMNKLKLSVKFKWNAISLLDEKSVIGNMASLSQQGFDSDTIIDYARNHGLNLRQGAEIEKPTENQLQDDAAPSRQRENLKTDKLKDNLDKKGVSAEGKVKLEKKKVL